LKKLAVVYKGYRQKNGVFVLEDHSHYVGISVRNVVDIDVNSDIIFSLWPESNILKHSGWK